MHDELDQEHEEIGIGRPSRYRPTVDQEKRAGCQACFNICPLDAIEKVKDLGSKK